jgi:hypothetical protein
MLWQLRRLATVKKGNTVKKSTDLERNKHDESQFKMTAPHKNHKNMGQVGLDRAGDTDCAKTGHPAPAGGKPVTAKPFVGAAKHAYAVGAKRAGNTVLDGLGAPAEAGKHPVTHKGIGVSDRVNPGTKRNGDNSVGNGNKNDAHTMACGDESCGHDGVGSNLIPGKDRGR